MGELIQLVVSGTATGAIYALAALGFTLLWQASGTINFVRKRPTNKDGGEVVVTAGSYELARVALDYNKVLSKDGAWAGRLVVVHDDRDTHLRALHKRRGTVYGVVDGQVGDDGVLTFGFTYQDEQTRSPMWGSLTLPYADGSLAEGPIALCEVQGYVYAAKRGAASARSGRPRAASGRPTKTRSRAAASASATSPTPTRCAAPSATTSTRAIA